MNVKKTKLEALTIEQLVDRFASITVAQDNALLGGQLAKFNRLYDKMKQVSDELKGRPDDQRRVLMTLYDYPNVQVQLQAAKLTLAVAPIEARKKLEAIAATHWMPQAGDAGMSLSNLDRGVFKPS